jgi:Ca2+-binding EF-hand superfamily protein
MQVPSYFRPLSSAGSRGRVCTMGQLVCTLIRNAINTDTSLGTPVDGAIIMGGNIRGGTDYPDDSFFSLEALEAEVKPEETVGIVDMPGWLLSDGIRATHSGPCVAARRLEPINIAPTYLCSRVGGGSRLVSQRDGRARVCRPIPGWFQYGDGIEQDDETNAVVKIGGRPIDREATYRIVTKVGDLTNGQSKPFTDYYTEHPDALPPKGNYHNIHHLLMAFFARNLWRRMWEGLASEVQLDEACEVDDDAIEAKRLRDEEACDEAIEQGVLQRIDLDGDGVVSVSEIHRSLAKILDLSTDDTQTALAEYVHRFADATGDGVVTLDDLRRFVVEERDGVFSDFEDALRVV